MKPRCSWLLAGLLLTGTLQAQESAPVPVSAAGPVAASPDQTPPSDESLHKLLEVARAHALLDSIRGQFDVLLKQVMDQAVQQGSQGKSLTAQQRACLDGMRVKLTSILDQTLNWDTLEPLYLRVYRESFTQTEVDGLTAFYQTPSGQALLTKMPLVMQNLLGEMKGMMQSVQQQMLEVQKETVQQLQNLPSAPQTNTG